MIRRNKRAGLGLPVAIQNSKAAACSAILVVAAIFFVAANLQAATYHVQPGGTYPTLQAVVGILAEGDVVEVEGDATYPGDVTFTRPGKADAKITIRGIRVNGRRPVISGGTNTVAFTTPWPYSGPGADHYVFEGFEVTGGSQRCIYHQADDLIVRDVVVHDCSGQGIHGADGGSGDITLEYVEVYACGSGDRNHQIYMATDEVHYPGSVFRMQYCYIHDGSGGNNVKSRAERNEIYYNWIENAYYHELELIGPDGGDGGDSSLAREDSDVVGNVLRKTARNGFVTRVGGDGTGESFGRYRFVNNTIISAQSAVFRLFDGLESIEMHNNIFYRNNGGAVDLIRDAEVNWTTGSARIAGNHNWVAQGALHVPSQWQETRYGTDPGFVDFSSADLRLASDSLLIDEADPSPLGVPGYAFPNPLPLPLMHPPLHHVDSVDSAEARPDDGSPDIGAYEEGADTPTPPGAPPGSSGSTPPDDTGGSGGGCFVQALYYASPALERN